MKSVCAKHEQAYEESCPWCEKKAEGPTAAPAAPPAATENPTPSTAVCDMTGCYGEIAWRWDAVAGEALARAPRRKLFMCQSCHAKKAGPFYSSAGWQYTVLP